MAVTELLHNAAEHAFPEGRPGRIELTAQRSGHDLEVRIADDGRGLPPGFDVAASKGLGLQIVRTLVTSELHGGLTVSAPAEGAGTVAVLTLPGVGRSPPLNARGAATTDGDRPLGTSCASRCGRGPAGCGA